jgi:hypothetical protein
MFKAWPKIPRYENESVVITEKLDGTNACVVVESSVNLVVEPPVTPLVTLKLPDKYIHIWAQSRTRLITPSDDNYGFAKWVVQNQEELANLGDGYHYGEWWGSGIQRNYGMDKKVFSLFNVGRWKADNTPNCCSLVPILYTGRMHDELIDVIKTDLSMHGSFATPHKYMRPEGMVIYYTQSKTYQKVIIDK